VSGFIDKIVAALGDRVRLLVDDRDQYTPGWKYNEHELRGVPVRLEVGPRDVAQGAVMSVRRDTRAKESIALEALATRLPALLDEIQRGLLESARAFRDQSTVALGSVDEFESHFAEKRGFVVFPWDGDAKLEAEIKERSGATLRCVPRDQQALAPFKRDARPVALFARAY
jgi:prolyl-tRNA synthetase